MNKINQQQGKIIFDEMIYDLINDGIHTAKINIVKKLSLYDINEMLIGIIEYSNDINYLIKFVAEFYFIPQIYKKYRIFPHLALSEIYSSKNISISSTINIMQNI